MRAVTIRQLVGATQGQEGDDLSLDGHDLTNVTLVAKVLSANPRGGSLEVVVTDGTGSVPVDMWTDESADGVRHVLHTIRPDVGGGRGACFLEEQQREPSK